MKTWYGALIITLMLSTACGGMSDTDIDATVEARVELAKSSLIAPTPVQLPTYTPVPVPTPKIIEKIVVKEIPVERIVELTAVPLPTYTPAPVVIVVVTATPTRTPMPTATPPPTPIPTPDYSGLIARYLENQPTPTATPTPIPRLLDVPYTASDGLTVTLTSFNFLVLDSITSVNLSYKLENDTLDLKNEQGWKLYYRDSGGLPQYGLFSQLLPGQTITRSYTFNVQAPEVPLVVAYPSQFSASTWQADDLIWKMSDIVIQSTRYKVTISSYPANRCGYVKDPSSGDDKYDYGAKVMVTAYPRPGYQFDRWSTVSLEDDQKNPVTVVINQDINMTALCSVVD